MNRDTKLQYSYDVFLEKSVRVQEVAKHCKEMKIFEIELTIGRTNLRV